MTTLSLPLLAQGETFAGLGRWLAEDGPWAVFCLVIFGAFIKFIQNANILSQKERADSEERIIQNIARSEQLLTQQANEFKETVVEMQRQQIDNDRITREAYRSTTESQSAAAQKLVETLKGKGNG